MGLPPTQADTPYVVESRVIERAVAEFEDAWLDGRPPSLDGFLETVPGAHRTRVLREVVHIDFERRLRAGESLRAEHYLERYPQMVRGRDDLLALVQWEYRLRKVHEPELGFDEYRARFPDLGPELLLWLARACCEAATVTAPDVPPALVTDGAVPGYDVLAELGRGGMGVVYKARHAVSRAVVALKVIRGDLLAHPAARRRFAREIQASMRLDHPHIVRVYDGAQAGDSCYLAMEYLEGRTLQQVVEQHGRRAVWEACELVRQAALGLDHAHACGLVHRDVKPSNLLVTVPAGTEGAGALKILDLGLVRIDGPDVDARLSTLTQPGVLMGTIDFIAPEQALNPHQADSRADLYSLGCTFYYLLLARVPFPVGSMIEKLDKHRWVAPRAVDRLRTEVPRVVAAVVDKLLAKEPADRYQTAAEVAAALAPYCTARACAAARAAQADAQVRAPNPPSSVLLRPLPREPHEPIGVLRRLTGHTDAVCSAALTADGAQIVSASRDRTVRVWDLAGAKPPRALYGHTSEVRCVAVSSAAKRIISGGSDRTVRVWDLPTGRLLSTLSDHADAVKAVATSDDGQLALSIGNDRRLVLWDLSSGKKVRSLKGHTGDPNCVAFAPGGELAVSGGWDKTLRVWDVPTGKELLRLGGAFSDFQWSVFMGLAFHPDGRLVVGSSDHTVCLLDLETGRVSQRFEGHTNWVSSVAVAPDGKHLLSGGWDGTVRLWNVAKGRQSACFEGHTDQVHSVAFAPDGVRAVSVSTDRTIVYWRVLP